MVRVAIIEDDDENKKDRDDVADISIKAARCNGDDSAFFPHEYC